MTDQSREKMLKWNMIENLRWLAEQDHRPDYMPCGMLTGQFLKLCADRWQGEIEKRAATEEHAYILQEKLDSAP